MMLIGSRALSAARPALIALLITSGAQFSGETAQPISFCNVLFVGNMCAAILVAGRFGIRKLAGDFSALSARVQMGLAVNGCLAALLSTLIFLGLKETSVTNAVLLGRIGPVLFALMGAVILGRRIARLEWAGFSLIVVGVLAIAFRASHYQVNSGDVLILLSTIVFAASTLINKVMIANVATLPVIVFSRNFISAAAFFVLALKFYGPHHFADAFSAQLWVLMAVYALIVVVAAQFLWYASFESLDSGTIGRLTVISPIFGVAYAYLINGERPSAIQLGTLVLVTVGVLIASVGRQRSGAAEASVDRASVDKAGLEKAEDVATP